MDMQFNLTKEEASSVLNVIQLIAVAGARIQYQPTLIPSDKEVSYIKSAFHKMSMDFLGQRLKGE